MRVSVSSAEGLERKLTIELPAAVVDASIDERLRETARDAQLKGFRKGRIPLHVARQRFGPGIRQKVISELMSRSCAKAIEQQGLRPANQPTIELSKPEAGKDLRFVAVFEVLPQVELPDFSEISFEELTAEITDDDIDSMVETLREQRQSWELVERAAAEHDMVNIDFAGRIGGEAFPGGEAKKRNVLLGSGHMIPGFEDAIQGRSPGERFTCQLQIPEDYENDSFAGKGIEFDITLNEVRESRLPEVDEQFYRSFGVGQGIEQDSEQGSERDGEQDSEQDAEANGKSGIEQAFRERIRRDMYRELQTARRNRRKEKITEALVKRVDLALPESLVAAETERLRSHFGGGAEQHPDGQPRAAGNALQLPEELLRQRARHVVTMQLILAEIVATTGMKAHPARVVERIGEIASSYESPRDITRWYHEDQERLSRIEAMVLEDQLFEHIASQTALTERKVSYKEAIRG